MRYGIAAGVAVDTFHETVHSPGKGLGVDVVAIGAVGLAQGRGGEDQDRRGEERDSEKRTGWPHREVSLPIGRSGRRVVPGRLLPSG